MKTKSLLSFLAAWTLFLALTFFAGPSATGLYAQADDAKEEQADEEKPDGEKPDGGQKGPAAAGPAPSVGADPGIRGEADARISLFRTGQYGSLTQFKSDFPTAAAASTAAANVSSLTALNLDLTSINNVLSAAGKNLTDVFGSDYSGVGAIVSAGGSKQAALESAITTALATNNSNVSNSGFRRGIGDASADVQKDYALILSVVDFAKSVAAPDGEFVSEVGSSSGAWDKISLEGLGATIQGIEKVTVEASDAGFDPDSVRADLGTQITATSALIVSELIESAPVTAKNAAGEIDYSNHLNGAVAQKLVIEEAIAEGSAKLTDLVKPASETVSILKTAVASAEAVSHVSKEIATTIAADIAAGNTPTKTAFNPKVAGKKVADVLFKKAEKVKVAAAANVAAGQTFTFDSTVFSPAAGAKVAETVYDVAESLDASTDLTFEATEALYDFAADFIADDASISATDVSALTLDASVLETIYVFADDVVADAGTGATIAAFDPEALEAVYTFAEDFKADAIAAGGTFDAATTFDAGKLEALEVMYEFAEDVAADAGANFDAGSAGTGGADYFNPEALEAMFDFAEDMHKDAIAGGQQFDASIAFADAGKLEALEVMYEFAEDVAADSGAGFEADFNPEALEAMFDFAEDMHKDAVAAGGTFEAGAMFAADAGKLEALEVMYEFAEDVAADSGAGFEADFDPEALEAMFDFAEDMHKDATAKGEAFEASTIFADAGKLEALEVMYEFAEDVGKDAGAGFEANFDPEALETIFDFAEDMHKDAVAAGGTFEASTAFDASKLEAIEAVYEFAEDLSLEGGDTFEADFDPEALEALYLFADDQVKAGKAGGDAFDPEALEAVFHIADDAVDEAGFDPNVGFDLKAFDAVYDYADAEADKAGFNGATGFDKNALEALYEFADQAVDEAGYDANVGFDANAFDALYDMVDVQADQADFDPNAGFDVRALDAVFDMADAQSDGKVFDPNAMLGMYEMVDAKADSDTISVGALGAMLGQFEEDAQQTGFTGFDTNDLADFGDMFDYAAKQGDPTQISDEDFDRMESWMDDQRSELAPGAEMPAFEQMEVVFNQIEDLAEGGDFDPDAMDSILALAQSGVGISQMDALDAMPQSTRDAFNNFQVSNPSEAGDLMASNPPLTNTELLMMLEMDPAKRTRLLTATSTDEAATSPTTPPLGEVLDQLRADMEERGVPVEAANIDGAFLDKSITLAEEAGSHANADIFHKIHDVADELSVTDPNLKFANPLVEAGQLANKLLTTVNIGQSQFSNPEGMDHHYQDRNRLLSNSYNIHVIRLLGKYAFPQTTTNVATKITAFLEDNTVFPGIGQNIQNLRDLFDNQNKNTDVLGARNLGHEIPFGKIPRQDPDDYGVIGGKKVYIDGTGNLDLSTYLRKTPDLAIAGVEEVHIYHSFTISGGQKPGTSAGLAITAPRVLIDSGKGIAFDGLYLGVGADEDITLNNVSLQNHKHLGLASLGNVTLNNCSLLGGHRGKVYVYAHETLTVDGVALSSDLAEVYMEAKTVNLSNVNFPRDSDVFLKSELGAIDGKYPNFGTVEAGRVNFINNVKYDGQSIHDRASFDQHGNRIKVGIINSNP